MDVEKNDFLLWKKKHVLASFSLYHEKWRFKVKLITKFKKENKGMYRNAMIEKFAQVNIFFKGLTSAILTGFFFITFYLLWHCNANLFQFHKKYFILISCVKIYCYCISFLMFSSNFLLIFYCVCAIKCVSVHFHL